jgi:hypothetical protein
MHKSQLLEHYIKASILVLIAGRNNVNNIMGIFSVTLSGVYIATKKPSPACEWAWFQRGIFLISQFGVGFEPRVC